MSRLEDAKKAIERDDRQRERNDIIEVLRSPEGRRFVYRILIETGVFNSTFNKETLVMAFLEGRRANGLWLLGELEKSQPEALLQMQREDRSKKTSEKAKLDAIAKEEGNDE